jgi:uncharacterized membrane protein
MQGLAWVSRALAGKGPADEAGRLERILSHDRVAVALGLAAIGELVADKHPSIPARIDPAPLLGRMVAGAAVGSVAAGRDRRLLGAMVGAGFAVATAWSGWFLRREAGRANVLPDLAIALAEDSLSVSLARHLVRS